MNKDLICITAHCPNEEKRRILHNLVLSLQPIRNDFDLMIVSHTPVTFDVQENVDWVIFDKDNELLTDWKYQNQPWFSPHEGKHIQSVFFGVGNTYLTLHKQLILVMKKYTLLNMMLTSTTTQNFLIIREYSMNMMRSCILKKMRYLK
jgi:hypothetical protein